MFERFSRSARTAVVMAQEDARQLRSPTVEVEHMLLALLGEAEPELRTLLAGAGLTHDGVRDTLAAQARGAPLGEQDAEALRSIGIDLDAVRESLEASFGEDALDRPAPAERGRMRGRWTGGHIPFSRDTKKVLELSLREALARRDRAIESGHLVLGILRSPNPAVARLLGDRASIDDLRTQVSALLDRAA